MINAIQQLDRGTSPGSQDGDTGFEGSGKIIDNFNELDNRTRFTTPTRIIRISVNPTITNEVERVVSGINGGGVMALDAGVNYQIIARTATLGIAAGTTNIEEVVYSLGNRFVDQVTIGNGGNFTFTTQNIILQRVARSVINQQGRIDLGDIGNVPIEAVVNALDPQVPIVSGSAVITAIQNGEDVTYLYSGNETALGQGITTVNSDYELISEPAPVPEDIQFGFIPSAPLFENEESLRGAILGSDIMMQRVLSALDVPYRFDTDNNNYYRGTPQLFGNQANQVQDRLYYLQSTDQIIRYLGTTNGDITDYEVQVLATGGEPDIEFTGNDIPLNKKRVAYNASVARGFSTFTSTLGFALGATAKVFYNAATEPSFPANFVNTGGVDFMANTDLDIFFEVETVTGVERVVYFYSVR